MSSKKTSDTDKTLQLTPGAGAAEPKLAVVKPGPRAVTVKVPTAAPVAKPASAPQKAETAEDLSPAAEGPIKKGDLLDQIVATTGVKRADAKLVTEAVFDAILTNLQAGRDLQIPPLGKVRVVNSKEVGQGATALTVKIRTPNPQ